MDKSIKNVVLEGAEGLHKAGLMSDKRLEEFKKLATKNPNAKEGFGLWKESNKTDEGFIYQERVRSEQNNSLEYKGFQGSIEYNADDDLLYGAVLSIEPLINYEGSTINELRAAFRAAIDNYLEDQMSLP